MTKRTAGLLAAATLCVWAGCTQGILGAAATDRVEKTLAFSDGGTLRLENVNGSVKVTEGKAGEVHLVAEKRVRAVEDARAREVLSQVRVEIEETAGEVRVRTVYPKMKSGGFLNPGASVTVTYALEVPRGTVLQLATVNGSVDVDVAGARVTSETTNGSIGVDRAALLHAATVNGKVRFDVEDVGEVSSTNGGLTGRIRSLKPKGGQLETVNGGIEVTLSAGAALRVEAENVNGSIRSELPGLSRAKHSVRGEMNGGGGTLTVETVNGSIELLQNGAGQEKAAA
ncbi:MAG: hypothetical protein AB1347_01715 [Acidobacteriota bacterium]